MSPHRKHRTILEVSLGADSNYQRDGFMSATHEVESCSFIVHNVSSPEFAARALRNIRHVTRVIDAGDTPIDESSSLYLVKVIYDAESIDSSDEQKFAAFKGLIRSAIARTNINGSNL